MSDPDRLDRIEALQEQFLQGLEQIRQGLEETRQRTDSNARSIEALTNMIREERQEAQRDRARLYQSLSELATAQANFYEVEGSLAVKRRGLFHTTQASLNSRLGELDQRQDEMVKTQSDIVKTQTDVAELLKFLINKQTD